MTRKDSFTSPDRRLRTASWLALLFLLFLAIPSAGRSQEPALDEPARFLIESIVVEGIERAATRDIVAKETRVEPGSTVDEDQLRLAIYRVRRLPFVVDADFSLRKGSERGRYALVVRIEMASSIFADLSANTGWERGEPGGGDLNYFGTIGARQFVGSGGYAFGSIDRLDNIQVGYTQFHLFGPGSFLSAAVSSNLDTHDGSIGVALSGGKPLSVSQSVRATTTYFHSDLFNDWGGSLEWVSDSTDDPLLPTRGERYSISTGFGSSRFSGSSSRTWTASALARRYWPLAAGHSLGAEIAAGHLDFRSTFEGSRLRASYQSASATLGYSWDLLRSRVGEPRNDLRFGAETHWFVSNAGTDSGISERSLSFETSLTYRRPQGSVRLSIFYLNNSHRQGFVP